MWLVMESNTKVQKIDDHQTNIFAFENMDGKCSECPKIYYLPTKKSASNAISDGSGTYPMSFFGGFPESAENEFLVKLYKAFLQFFAKLLPYLMIFL